MPAPLVTVVMPVRNEGGFIERSLGSVLAQDYPRERLEVIVADGMSTDKTRKVISDLASSHTNLRLIDNPPRIVATGLNLALREARGEFIVRVDGHTVIAPDYVKSCVNALASTSAENVGGRMTAVGQSRFGQAVAAATSSRFGVGGARFHYSTVREWVDTVYLGAWHRDLFGRIGDFDEEMVRNQDDEFNYRLRAHGGTILLDPAIKSEYYNRSTPWSLWKQYFQYGWWKVRVLQKHPGQMQPRQFMPGLFVLTLVLLLLAIPIFSLSKALILTCALAYVIANLTASVLANKAEWRPGVLSLTPMAFAIMHFAYGCGFLIGVIRFWDCWVLRRQTPAVQPSQDLSL